MKKNFNLIAHNVDGIENVDSQSFTMDYLDTVTADLYKQLLQTIKGLHDLDSETFNKKILISLAKNLYNKNTKLLSLFQRKHDLYLSSNETLLSKFDSEIEQNSLEYQKKLEQLKIELEQQIETINLNLVKFQQEAVTRYKQEENNFLPKARFLSSNKKINKEEYMKIVAKINHHRIEANQNYHEVANDLSSKNEQQQLRFKHSIESSIEKNIYDKAIINEDFEEQSAELDQTLDELIKRSKQAISIKEKAIINNTITLNNMITKIGEDYSNTLKYAFVPYDIKRNKLVDELNENGKNYTELESKVLEEFKTLLQQNDSEIESLREEHRLFKEKYLKDLRELKKTFNINLQSEINKINKDIAAATKKYTSSLLKEDKEEVRKLVAIKKAHIKSQKKILNEQIRILKEQYYLQELKFIERFETLRTKKSECEAIKSSAMKNINYDRVYHHERINSEIRLINNEKESYSTTDHYEESKDVYKARLQCDIENENIRYEINELELQIYADTIDIKYKKDLISLEKDYNIDLSNADLLYQQESINNRINYFNVKTMLEIQKENIINEFETFFANEKMHFELVKNIFYNNCDNIQYELYKVDNELKYRLIDNSVKLNQELSEIEKTHINVLNSYKQRAIIKEKQHNEYMININLYQSRLEIEKTMFYNSFDFFKEIMANLSSFENYFHSHVYSLTSDVFNKNKKNLIIATEYIRKLKFNYITLYYDQARKILTSRVAFEKDLKFKKMIEETQKDALEFITASNERIKKSNQTIASFNETIFSAKEAIRKNKQEIFKLKWKLIKYLFNSKKKAVIKKEINTKQENILLIKKQIKANQKNVRNLQKLEVQQVKERVLREKKYQLQLQNIQKNLEAGAILYNDVFKIIEQQYNKLSTYIIQSGNITSTTKYEYKHLNKIATKIFGINDYISQTTQNNFQLHYTTYVELLNREYLIQKNNYLKEYNRHLVEIENSIKIENKEFEASKQTIKSTHKSLNETLERQIKIRKNELLQELAKLNDNYFTEYKKFIKKIKEIENKKNFELKCHQENYDMYTKNYTDTNTQIINTYLKQVDEIKKKYHANLKALELKYKANKTKIKNQHISNETLRKNNIQNINNEYKENIDIIMIKIKKIAQQDKIERQKHEENKKIYYKLYLLNQRNTRKEFAIQLREIEKKCKRRIKEQQTEFIKNFKQNKD